MLPSTSNTEPRSRSAYNYREWEFKEWRAFRAFSKKALAQFKCVRSFPSWSSLFDGPISRVSTSYSEALSYGDTLPVVSEECVITTTDDQPLAFFLKQGAFRPWNIKDQSKLKGSVNIALAYLDDNLLTKCLIVTLDTSHCNISRNWLGYRGRRWGLPLWPLEGTRSLIRRTSLNKVHAGEWIGYALHGSIEAIRVANPFGSTMSMLFEGIDGESHRRYRDIYRMWRDRTSIRPFDTCGRACFLTMAIVRNLRVEPYKDSNNIKDGWVGMCCWGDFTCGNLALPDLNIQPEFCPGDVISFRSAVLEHFVLLYVGERTSFVFFTKRDLVA